MTKDIEESKALGNQIEALARLLCADPRRQTYVDIVATKTSDTPPHTRVNVAVRHGACDADFEISVVGKTGLQALREMREILHTKVILAEVVTNLVTALRLAPNVSIELHRAVNSRS